MYSHFFMSSPPEKSHRTEISLDQEGFHIYVSVTIRRTNARARSNLQKSVLDSHFLVTIHQVRQAHGWKKLPFDGRLD